MMEKIAHYKKSLNRFTPILSCGLFLCMSGCSFWENAEEKQTTVTIDEKTLRYKTHFPKNINPKLLNHLKKASILKRLEVRPPLTPFALEKRAEKDVKELLETLDTHGYFEGDVRFNMNKNGDVYEIDVIIEEGPLYRFSGFDIQYEGHLPEHSIDLNELNLPLKKDDPVNLEKALEIGKKIAKYWRTKGYPFAKALDMKGIKNVDHKTIKLIFNIRLGPKGSFGQTIIDGLEHLDPIFVNNRLDYVKGKIFDEKLLESTRKTLIETGLFNEITLQPHPNNTDQTDIQSNISNGISLDDCNIHSIPIHLHLKEGPPRSIGGGAKYSSAYGFSGKVFWRHDNAFGKGESVETKFTAGKRKNEAKVGFSKPDFGLKKQTLYAALSATEEFTRAYHSKAGKSTLGFAYDISREYQLNYGIDYEIAQFKRNKIVTHSKLLGIPFIAEYDSTNNILNPIEGIKARLKTNPYVGKYAGKNGFWVNEIFASTYFHPSIRALEESDNIFVLATWGKAGVIAAKDVNTIPPSKRFYSGGGNSVRGYGFQLLGPFDNAATPTGGLSIVEFGTEAR
ncbi:MAG: BamA/TamA family outer membrane protein, partial [Alphaproteobacteria bacterium]|nr:BamA/TamA family outer membrane protein [Alphaproteobacteria bacterium]